MPKKTSRSARALQAQRTALAGDRRPAARPLIDVNNSRLVAEADTDTGVEETTDFDAALEPKTAPVPEPALAARAVSATTPRPVSGTRPAPAASSSNTIRPATPSRRPIARRTTTAVNRASAISREEEYAFIRSDLMTVFALTVLMIVVLVILTFVIGR